jgi:hypothetical protein
MAILIRGKTVCALCGQVIKKGEKATLFPHFVVSRDDPLWKFTDRALHTVCVARDPLGPEAIAVADSAVRQDSGDSA